MRMSCWLTSSESLSAAKVVTLNHRVPMSWMPVAHQSIRVGASSRRSSVTGCFSAYPPTAWSAVTVWMCCSSAALVKNSEPTKNVMPSTLAWMWLP